MNGATILDDLAERLRAQHADFVRLRRETDPAAQIIGRRFA